VARRNAPFFGGDTSQAADPLPQAFVLTAIVIAFAITVVLATFAVVGRNDDDTEAGAEAEAEAGDAPRTPIATAGDES
jgi:multicomponent Na+:H+ antiporter subunit C